MWNFAHNWDLNSAKNDSYKDRKTQVFAYTLETILWTISGPYVDRCDLSFLKLKCVILDIKWTLTRPKVKISDIRKNMFLHIPLKQFYEQFLENTWIAATQVFKAQNV